ncbi:Fe-S-cluster-containing dehydrogenase component [Burkholderia sp. YR290]|jgi:Fe-S-cluster-containing dehydrogenase component|uniref:4Fe-4S dicluster domain-containing protein n=1 Tax=Paraburkholderia hospita TaxID=169430 RepID=UPI0009A5B7A3|nr:4Fe-4S dicluster domain-containing protein [Paraburkholderia hospita]SKC92894.1 Fe-S-cluster-containing dehydrogenase component [Paraburkholderia hospita]SOE90984.1 Fe-S-cluster-containing dehydrogenase component [Burkholderia sp. YR290]
MSKWNLVIKVGRCENCQNCVIAARDEHVGNDFPGYAAPAAPDAESPVRILRRVQGDSHMVETTYLPVMCNHCDEAPCMRVGGSAIRKRADGIVIIDPDKARGRKDIVKSCPYKAIVWNEELQLPQIWIFDAHLLDQGWPQPRCQQSCPTDVFETVKLDDAAMAEKARREGLKGLRPNLGTKPRVWYSGLERWETCFIGGSVSAQIEDVVECVTDASVALYVGSQKVAETVSDSFGDFRFGGLVKGSGLYRVEIRHALGKAWRECELGESVYLGEVSLAQSTNAAEVVSP